MKKRRTFDIDLPEDDTPEPAAKQARRSPMAAAISETADSLRDRRAIESEIRAENDALAAEHVRMKKLGLIVDLVPLDAIRAVKLARDRAGGLDDDIDELVASIRDIGLSNPIRVEARGDGRFELVQGMRRLSAYRKLLDDTGDNDRWGSIPAGILPHGEDLPGLYRRMVDENLVRKDISFAEMAQLALAYAQDPDTPETDPDKAVAQLFQSAGYQKRSYIRQFIRVIEAIGPALRFPTQISRALGLKLAYTLQDQPEVGEQLSLVLTGMPDRDAAQELEVLQAAAVAGAGRAGGAKPNKGPTKAKTTFQLSSKLGQAKCTAVNGRLEIKLDRDFASFDRRKLERAVLALLNEFE